TTLIIKSGKARYAWVTLVPLAWLLTVTMTAGYQKIFAADPRLGFLAHVADVRLKIFAGTQDAAVGARLIFNDQLNAALAGFCMLVVVLLVLTSARVWLAVLRGRKAPPLREAPFVLSS